MNCQQKIVEKVYRDIIILPTKTGYLPISKVISPNYANYNKVTALGLYRNYK